VNLPSPHYLITIPHHRRQADGTILTSIVHDGVLTLARRGSTWGWRRCSLWREWRQCKQIVELARSKSRGATRHRICQERLRELHS